MDQGIMELIEETNKSSVISTRTLLSLQLKMENKDIFKELGEIIKTILFDLKDKSILELMDEYLKILEDRK